MRLLPRKSIRAHRVGAVVGAAALLVGLLVHPAAADPSPGQGSAQDQVRAQMKDLAGQIDTSKASLDEIDSTLATLDANAATQQAALARAQADLAAAQVEQEAAATAIAASSGRVKLLQDMMRQRAVNAYVHPSTDDLLNDVATGDYLSASKRSVFISLRAITDAELAKELRKAQDGLRARKDKAREAEAQANEEEARQTKLIADTQAAMADRHQVFEKLRVTMAAMSVRNDELVATDRALAAQQAQSQALLQSRLLSESLAPAPPPPPTRASTTTTTPAPFTSLAANGGSEGEPLVPGVFTGNGTQGISLCNVSGITVNCVIRGQLQAMIDAAQRANLTLTGGGFRDPRQQIALRMAHCGTSYYAIYQAGASSCSPPTARPGTSQHEVGLAIDFSGSDTRSTPIYQWLAANAATFGFYNLPSEAWHWSTSGY
jgi:hypothetical protein